MLASRGGSKGVGPSNDTSETTTTVYQEELAAANAKIEQLKALLEARNTLATSETSSSEARSADRLADVLEALT